MKKLLLHIILITLLGTGIWVLGSSASHASYFFPHYWVSGTISTNPSGISTQGRNAIIFENTLALGAGIFVSGETENGSYLLNASDMYGLTASSEPYLIVGNTYWAYIMNDKRSDPANGYGADPVSFEVSGIGLDVVNLQITKGGGALWPGAAGGATPVFEWIKFGDRIYQKALVEKGQPFYVSSTPKISAKVNSISALDVDNIVIKINENSPSATGRSVIKVSQMGTLSNKSYATKSVDEKAITSLAFAYDVSEQNKLVDGSNTVTFYANNTNGGTSEIANVIVSSGSVSVIDQVLTYPSPFSVTKDGKVTIQYTLSTDSDIDVFVFSPVGEIVKKFVCPSSINGGAAGVNKITWDGTKLSGRLSGNAIYSGAIVAHGEGKILARFKLTIVD